MKRALFVVLAAVMFGVVAVLRHHSSDIVRGFGIVAMSAMWFSLAFAISITPWECSMEKWKSVRERGRGHYVFAQGGFWLAFLSLMSPSFEFAGGEIRPYEWWIWVPAGILAGPVLHWWDWKQRERKFQEWEKTGPLPEDGVV